MRPECRSDSDTNLSRKFGDMSPYGSATPERVPADYAKLAAGPVRSLEWPLVAPLRQAAVTIEEILAASGAGSRGAPVLGRRLHGGDHRAPRGGVGLRPYRYQPDGGPAMTGQDDLVARLRTADELGQLSLRLAYGDLHRTACQVTCGSVPNYGPVYGSYRSARFGQNCAGQCASADVSPRQYQ